MNKRTLIFVIIAWIFLTIVQYYFLPYFIVLLLWLVLSGMLFIVFLIEFITLIEERKHLSRFRVFELVTFGTLFVLTFWNTFVNGLIEKVDWTIFYNKRMEIVAQVKQNKLNPNVSWNDWICELPFDFPVISNGGNDIGIDRNLKSGAVTVIFFIFRNYMEAPSTEFVYTNDIEKKREFEKQIKFAPKDNWKIKDDWYRVTDR